MGGGGSGGGGGEGAVCKSPQDVYRKQGLLKFPGERGESRMGVCKQIKSFFLQKDLHT